MLLIINHGTNCINHVTHYKPCWAVMTNMLLIINHVTNYKSCWAVMTNMLLIINHVGPSTMLSIINHVGSL